MTTSRAQPWYPWYVVFILSVASMFSYIDRSLIYLLVEPIRADLQISDLQMSFLQGIAFGIFYALMGVPIARLADRKSRRAIIAMGIALWSLMTFFCGLARSFNQLFLARVGVGIGEASLLPAASSLLVDYFPREKLARANAILMLGGAVGAGLAVLLGGKLIALVTAGHPLLDFLPGSLAAWQKVFVIVGLPGVLLALILFITVKEPGRGGKPASSTEVVPIKDILHFVRIHKSTFTALLIAIPLMAAVTGGWLAWLPTFLIRQYNMLPQDAAYAYGMTILIFSLSGTILTGVITDWLMAKGYTDAPIRFAIISALIMALLGGISPLLQQQSSALLLIGLFLFFTSFITILPLLSIQLIAPPTMRAQLIACLLLVVAVIGSLGPTVVALFTDLVFQNDLMLGKSLSITAVILCLPAAATLYLSMPAFRNSINAVE